MIRSRRYHRSRRLAFENLESRLALTWAGVPPTSVLLPATPTAVTLNSQNDASGTASIATTEVDYYSFTAGASRQLRHFGHHALEQRRHRAGRLLARPASGSRTTTIFVLASNTDSRVTINLTAGTRYYVGITNYTSSSRGSYTWIDRWTGRHDHTDR